MLISKKVASLIFLVLENKNTGAMISFSRWKNEQNCSP